MSDQGSGASTNRSTSRETTADGRGIYLALFNSIDQGFCTIDVTFDVDDQPIDCRFAEVSPSFARQTGVEHAAGRSIREAAPDHQRWCAIYARVSLTGEPARFEEHSTSLERWWSVYAFRIEDRSRGQIGVLFSDITQRTHAEAEARANEERHAFVLQLGDALRPLTDARDVKRLAARLVGEHLAADHVHYREMVGEVVVSEADYGDGLPSMAPPVRYQDFGERLVASYRSGRTSVCCDVTTDATITDSEAAAMLASGFRAHISVPLVKHGAWVATLAVHSRTPRIWTSHEIAVAQEAAERTWAAVERARAKTTLHERDAQQAYLLKLSDALRPLSHATDIQAHAVRLLGNHLAASRTFYGELDSDGETIVVDRDHAPELSSMVGRHPFSALGGHVKHACQAGLTLAVADAADAARGGDADLGAYEANGFRAFVCVPVVKNRRLIAVLVVHHETPREWSDAEITLVQETAERTWAAVQRAHAEDVLRASEDALRRAHHELERRVEERTSDLSSAITALQTEVDEHREAEAQIKALFERLVSIQEAERRRIARDIHDQLGPK